MTDLNGIASRINDQGLAIAQMVTNIHFAEKPEFEIRYGKAGREKSIQDTVYHLSYLAESIRSESENIFNTYLEWVCIVLHSRNVPPGILIESLQLLDKICSQLLQEEDYRFATTYITKGIEQLKNANLFPSSYLTEPNPLLAFSKQYLALLLAGDRQKARALINELVENKHSISSIFENVFQATQHEVGLLWQTNKITVAHEHYCTATTQQIMSSLYPHIFSTKKKGLKMMACAVSGDLHELGIRMVSDMFELDGWDTYYLGANMPDANILTSIKEQKVDVLALSVTMPFHLSKAETLIKKIRDDEDINKLVIILGGYTLNIDPALWKRVGADGTARNSNDAVELANRLVKNNSNE